MLMRPDAEIRPVRAADFMGHRPQTDRQTVPVSSFVYGDRDRQ